MYLNISPHLIMNKRRLIIIVNIMCCNCDMQYAYGLSINLYTDIHYQTYSYARCPIRFLYMEKCDMYMIYPSIYTLISTTKPTCMCGVLCTFCVWRSVICIWSVIYHHYTLISITRNTHKCTVLHTVCVWKSVVCIHV
jgi:hypothetical protein